MLKSIWCIAYRINYTFVVNRCTEDTIVMVNPGKFGFILNLKIYGTPGNIE